MDTLWNMKDEQVTYYVDGGTKNNGQFGLQESVICCIQHKRLKPLFFERVGDKTNNEAELLAIRRLLQLTKKETYTSVVYCDSQLAVNLVKGIWRTEIIRLKDIVYDIWYLLKHSKGKYLFFWVPREENLAGHFIEERTGL